MVPLNLDLSVLHRATGATGFLQLSGELFFLALMDARKILHDRYRFAAAMRRLAKYIDAATILNRLGLRYILDFYRGLGGHSRHVKIL